MTYLYKVYSPPNKQTKIREDEAPIFYSEAISVFSRKDMKEVYNKREMEGFNHEKNPTTCLKFKPFPEKERMMLLLCARINTKAHFSALILQDEPFLFFHC